MKIQKVTVPTSILKYLLKTQLTQQQITSLPSDAEIIAVEQTTEQRLNHCFTCYITSDTFEDIQEGCEIPELPPITCLSADNMSVAQLSQSNNILYVKYDSKMVTQHELEHFMRNINLAIKHIPQITAVIALPEYISIEMLPVS